MTEIELNSLSDNNIFYIQILDNYVIQIVPYAIATIIKRREWDKSDKCWKDSFEITGQSRGGLPPHYIRTTLDMLFVTEKEAQVGVAAYLDAQLIEIDKRKVQLTIIKEDIKKVN